MKFLVDAQLPPALARYLCAQGHDATHVFDVGFVVADDLAIWKHAYQSQATIITKDEDFMDRLLVAKEVTPVVLIRIGNCSNPALLTWFASLLPQVVERLAAGELLIELR